MGLFCFFLLIWSYGGGGRFEPQVEGQCVDSMWLDPCVLVLVMETARPEPSQPPSYFVPSFYS